MAKIYTRKGDDGTTGLLFGGRVPKDSPAIEANGAVDEAQAIIGLARAESGAGELNELLVGIERDLWVLMAEVATAPTNRRKLEPGRTQVTAAMITALEATVDVLSGRFEMPVEFVVPGQNRVSATLDVARTVVRRAERLIVAGAASSTEGASLVGPYLNRLSDLLWAMARWQEGEHHLLSKKLPSEP